MSTNACRFSSNQNSKLSKVTLVLFPWKFELHKLKGENKLSPKPKRNEYYNILVVTEKVQYVAKETAKP
jgi:hypothetical protein